MRNPLLYILFSLALLLSACGGDGDGGSSDYETDQTDPTPGDWVVLHQLSDPDDLNPITGSDAATQSINTKMHYRLLEYHPETFEPRGLLAVDRPTISEDGMQLDFEIREEATWDNGEPVTAKDVLFSMKVVMNPLTEAQHLRPYVDYVQDIEIDPKNPKKFTVIANKPYMFAETGIGMTLWILPEYFYDPDGLMADFTLPQLHKDKLALMNDPNIKAFASAFNEEPNKRDHKRFSGCGPYKFSEWKTGQQIELVKKKDHWTDKAELEYLRTYPDKLVYKIINDPNAAIVELKKQNLDVMHGIPARDFKKELTGNEKVEQHYKLAAADMYAFSMIAMNNMPSRVRPQLFTDPKVRRAMAHLFDADKYIKNVLYGYGEQIVGPISPLSEGTYNDRLKPIEFNPDKAAQLLDEAGWKDSDGDGIRDKVIDGKKTAFKAEVLFNQGNKARESLGSMLSSEAKKIGVQIDVVALDWKTMLDDRVRPLNYDMFIIGWLNTPEGGDPSQLWHSDQIKGGSNYLGYSNPEIDRLTEEIRRTVDKNKRDVLFQKFQEILYEDQPCVFTVASKNRMAIHKRYQNAEPSSLRPGYFEHRFWSPTANVRYK